MQVDILDIYWCRLLCISWPSCCKSEDMV